LNYTRYNGINVDNEYAGGPYVGYKKPCNINNFYQRFYNTGGWAFVPFNNPNALLARIAV